MKSEKTSMERDKKQGREEDSGKAAYLAQEDTREGSQGHWRKSDSRSVS